METGIIVYLVIGLLIASYNLGYEVYNGRKDSSHIIFEFVALPFLWIVVVLQIIMYWIMGMLADKIFADDNSLTTINKKEP